MIKHFYIKKLGMATGEWIKEGSRKEEEKREEEEQVSDETSEFLTIEKTNRWQPCLGLLSEQTWPYKENITFPLFRAVL